jgi:hypothetical protein
MQARVQIWQKVVDQILHQGRHQVLEQFKEHHHVR